MIDSPDWDSAMGFLGGPTTDPQISTTKIILNGASPALLSAWQDASDKTKIALAVLAAGQFSLDQMPRAASGFLHGKGVGVNPAYDLLVAADIPGLDTAKITTGQFSLTRMPRAASGFLRGKGVGADPAYEALVAADIPSLDTSKITTGRFTAARLLDGTSGYFLKAQGAGVDPLYALLVAADIPSLDVAKITTGTFAVARGGTGLATIAAGGILYASALDVLSRIAPSAANQVLRSTGANALEIAALVAADIPGLDVAKIITGVFAEARGGTNQSGYTLGDILYASALNTLAKLAGNITVTRKFLRQVGNGSVSAAPAWATLQSGDLPSHSHVKADVTDFAHGYVSHSGSIIPAADQNFGEQQALAFRVENLASLPAAGNKGRLVLLTTDNKVYFDNGTSWVAM
jgi:hypothetical protein